MSDKQFTHKTYAPDSTLWNRFNTFKTTVTQHYVSHNIKQDEQRIIKPILRLLGEEKKSITNERN